MRRAQEHRHTGVCCGPRVDGCGFAPTAVMHGGSRHPLPGRVAASGQGCPPVGGGADGSPLPAVGHARLAQAGEEWKLPHKLLQPPSTEHPPPETALRTDDCVARLPPLGFGT